MFGFSITKLLFTIAAVVIVWQGFKWFNRMQENRDVQPKAQSRRAQARSASPGTASKGASVEAEEMVKCPVCETYVSTSSAVNCGKDACPYPG